MVLNGSRRFVLVVVVVKTVVVMSGRVIGGYCCFVLFCFAWLSAWLAGIGGGEGDGLDYSKRRLLPPLEIE